MNISQSLCYTNLFHGLSEQSWVKRSRDLLELWWGSRNHLLCLPSLSTRSPNK